MGKKSGSQATVSIPKKLVTELAKKHDMPQKAVVGLFDEFIELTARADVPGRRHAVRTARNAATGAFTPTPAKKLGVRSPKSAARIDPLIKRVAALVGNEDRAIAWFNYQPIPAFGGKTARELVAANRREAVSLHLDTLENGVFA